ncbi:hypothetical protein TKK_0010279 [Trichogramma kaykai]|uniref:Transposase domain-containing protein n=1 Tax=Trichogramma kaykai TaxID=54128 RepID=A0ABD2WZN8_9HYME
MSRRKPFHLLSERSKRRRIAQEVQEEMLEFESDSSDSDSSYSLTDNSETQINSTVQVPREKLSTNDMPQKSDDNDFEKFLDHLEIESDGDINYFSDSSNFSDSELFSECDDEMIESSDNDDGDDNNPVPYDLKSALKSWQIEHFINRGAMNKLLCLLREAGHKDLPKDARTLQRTKRKTLINQCDPGEYYHYGLEKALKDKISKETDPNIKVKLNIDGLPISKSTKRTLWPIQGCIAGEHEPFIIGVYHGTSKPSSVDDYLKPLINECANLKNEGFELDGKHYNFLVKSIICDSPAASYVLCIKQHNGYFACRKCMVEGDYDSRMEFLEDAQLRTDTNFRNRLNEEHHKGLSPFETLDINMITFFPLDYMHLVCLGVTKLLIRLWLKVNPRFSAIKTERFSESFTSLKPYVPKEFNRKPESILNYRFWKATTLRFFMLDLSFSEIIWMMI